MEKNVEKKDFLDGPVAKTPSAGGPSLITGHRTRSHKPQLKILHARNEVGRPHMLQLI